MQSFQIALEERNFRVLDILIDLTQKMVEGELIQLNKMGRMDVTEEDARSRRPTRPPACSVVAPGWAAFLAVLTKPTKRLSTILAAIPDSRFSWLTISWISRLRASNWASRFLAISKEGKVTLPLIYAMENGHREARELVARVLEEKEFNSVQPETLVALVRDSGALERTRNLAHEYARRAKSCINAPR